MKYLGSGKQTIIPDLDPLVGCFFIFLNVGRIIWLKGPYFSQRERNASKVK